MMKKCCFIVLYFGKMPSYIEVFLKSCSYNSDYDWLIITDDKRPYKFPNNVFVRYLTFEEIRKKIQSKFDFKISLEEPYKLCDYKPAYGYIFEEFIKDKYKFWGHCDIDIICGNLNKFMTDAILEKYDRIFELGHMILYKNTYENNRIFMKEYNGKLLYKMAFQNPKIDVFDEFFFEKENIRTLFIDNKKKMFSEDYSFNIKSSMTKFVRTKFDYKKQAFIDEKFIQALYVFDRGRIFRYYIKDRKLIKEEYMYMHFQDRKMTLNKKILVNDIFKILPNRFEKLEVGNVTIHNFNKIKKKKICFHIFEKKVNNKIKHLKKMIKGEIDVRKN